MIMTTCRSSHVLFFGFIYFNFDIFISQAAQKFYSLLVLKKFQALDIKQDVAYGDILVTKGIMFDNPKL